MIKVDLGEFKKVTQLGANQFSIETSKGEVFQSYESICMFIPLDEDIIYLGADWDYSTTTNKYRMKFRNYSSKELKVMIREGTAKVLNLDVRPVSKALQVKRLVQTFEKGKIENIDELLKELKCLNNL